MFTEEWKPVPGYEALYSVSSLGRVRRDAGGRGATAGRVITPKGRGRKYRHVDLSKGDTKKRFLVHRLVALAFLGEPPPGAEVNHKNFDGGDNRVGNLEWVTGQENVAHAVAAGRIGGASLPGIANGRAVLRDEDVVAILRMKGELGQREIASRFGVARSLVQRIHQRKAWRHIEPNEWPEDLRVRQFPEAPNA